MDFQNVDPHYFELFTKYILHYEGFHNIDWYGRGGGDRARDIVGYTREDLPFNLSYERKWIFQCKRYKKFPANNIIANEIATALQHEIDIWVLVIPLELTSSQLDYLKSLESIYKIKVRYICLNDLEYFLNKYPDLEYVLLHGTLLKKGVV